MTSKDEIETLQEQSSKLVERLSSISDKIITKWAGEEYQKHMAGFQHQHIMQKGQEEIKSHQGNVKRMEQLSKSNLKELQDRFDKLQELKASLQRLQGETDNVLHLKENANSQLGEESKKILKEREYLSLQGKVTQQKLDELDKAATMFHSRLGLTFKKTSGNRLQCLFKHIDRDDPESIFYFYIKVDGEDRKYVGKNNASFVHKTMTSQWIPALKGDNSVTTTFIMKQVIAPLDEYVDSEILVSDCEPPVSELDVLVEKLNQTNNLRSFIVCMRKRFQQIVQDQKSQ